MLFVSAANVTIKPVLLLICLFSTVYSRPNLRIFRFVIYVYPVSINSTPRLGLEG